MSHTKLREHALPQLSRPQDFAGASIVSPIVSPTSSASVAHFPFASLLHESSEAIVVVDGRGKIQLCSRGAESMLGFRAEEIIGRRARTLLVRGAYEIRQLLLQLARQGGLENYEAQVYQADHSPLTLRIAVTSTRDEHGRYAGFLIVLRKHLPERDAAAELRRREEELENFVYVISHNLKTPIISIQGFANLLREELGEHLNAEHLHFLDRIQKNAVQMEKMILELLDFSRLRKENFKPSAVQVRELLREVIDEAQLLEQVARKQNAQAAQTAPPEIILPEEMPHVWADANALKTVFQNLLNNAMKYRRADTPLRIEIGWQELPRFHALWVRDNGIGMEPLFQKKAFDLFQRGPYVGHIAGTGVGLAVVRRIIEKHKGLVRLDSKLGEGTTIYFTLPKAEPEQA